MKVLVTGANGYLGCGVVKKLLDDGINVVATDLKSDRIDGRAQRVVCDLFDVCNPYEYFDNPDVVLHMAWRDGFVHNSDSHIEDLAKHHSFLEKMFRSDAERIAVMGSMHEVGFWEGSIDENSPCHPMSLYGIAKNALRLDVEYLSQKYKKEFQWLRGFYIVGNTSYGSSIFSKLYKAGEAGEKEFPFTLGLNQFDFIDYDMFCLQVTAVIEQNKRNGIINICTGRPEKLANRVERFIQENGFDIKLQYGAYPDRPYDSKAVWGNNCIIEEILKERESQ